MPETRVFVQIDNSQYNTCLMIMNVDYMPEGRAVNSMSEILCRVLVVGRCTRALLVSPGTTHCGQNWTLRQCGWFATGSYCDWCVILNGTCLRR